MKRTFRQEARIAWRRGQWADVEAFLRGEHVKRTVGPGMHEPDDGTAAASDFLGNTRNDGRVLEHPDLARLDRGLR